MSLLFQADEAGSIPVARSRKRYGPGTVVVPGPFPSNDSVVELSSSAWKTDGPQYAQKGAGHMPAPHIGANRLTVLTGSLVTCACGT